MKITINRCSNRFNLELQNENLSILQLNFDLNADEEGLKKKRKKQGKYIKLKYYRRFFMSLDKEQCCSPLRTKPNLECFLWQSHVREHLINLLVKLCNGKLVIIQKKQTN